MSTRLVQIYLPESHVARLEEILPRHSRKYWRETVPGLQEKYSSIVQQRYTERLLEELDEAFASLPTFTVYVTKLEAAELGEIICASRKFERDPDAITVCDLTGVGTQDAEIALLACSKVSARGYCQSKCT